MLINNRGSKLKNNYKNRSSFYTNSCLNYSSETISFLYSYFVQYNIKKTTEYYLIFLNNIFRKYSINNYVELGYITNLYYTEFTKNE